MWYVSVCYGDCRLGNIWTMRIFMWHYLDFKNGEVETFNGMGKNVVEEVNDELMKKKRVE